MFGSFGVGGKGVRWVVELRELGECMVLKV